MLSVIASTAQWVTLVQVLLTGPYHAPPAAEDSVRTLRSLRSAQVAFESFRRLRLPIGDGRSGPCDITIGRYCYWRGDETGERPVAEPRPIEDRRNELIRTLDSASRLLPGDEWIAGQYVRYLVEANRIDDVFAFTDRCAAARAWCNALRGYAAQVDGRFAAADSAYAVALSAMPESERCNWLDASDDLADDLAARFKTVSCAAREAFVRRAAFIGAPLYLVSATDLFTEHLARVTRAKIAEHSANPYGMGWADDQRLLVVRYGWPAWYTRTAPEAWSQREPTIVGHDAGLAYYFFPAVHAFDAPAHVARDEWALNDPRAMSGYTPRYARTMHDLVAQVAAFRRGDSTLIVAAWDARRDTTLIGRELVTGVTLASPERVIAMATDSAKRNRGVMSVAGRLDSGLVSVEVLAREDRRAARVRLGVAPRSIGRVALSDLLLYSPTANLVSSLSEVRDSALASDQVPLSRVIGVYWEMCGLRHAGEPVHYTLAVERRNVGWLRRTAERLHIADPSSGLRIQWDEVPPQSEGVAGRGVRVVLSQLRAGRYEVRLSAAVNGEPPVSATREVEVR
jgi:hypothetical protein